MAQTDPDDATPRFETDGLKLATSGQHEGGSQRRVTGEGELHRGREDADPCVRRRAGWTKDKRGLREVGLARERLHRRGVDVVGIGEDGQRVSREWAVGEYVAELVGDLAHRSGHVSSPRERQKETRREAGPLGACESFERLGDGRYMPFLPAWPVKTAVARTWPEVMAVINAVLALATVEAVMLGTDSA